MLRHLLSDHWTLALARPGDDASHDDAPFDALPASIPATVPGCVHTDLLDAGLIEDPFYDRNELDLQWIGASDWVYRCTFDAPARLLDAARCELACDGLDTVATVTLNGTTVGSAANMHCRHRFEVGHALQAGSNTLAVRFDSAIRYAERMEARLGPRPHINQYPFNFIRKMACNFGWDWGPVLVTAGIWKPIALEAWSTARIDAVRPLITRADPDRATVAAHVDLAWAQDAERPVTLDVELTAPDGHRVARSTASVAPGHDPAVTSLDVEAPARWWPAGYGEQPLYTLRVTAREGDHPLDTWSSRLGLRTVALDAAPDAEGAAFTIRVNGEPVLCKGANWIPDDAFVTRVDKGQYRERLQQALDANMNMVRVWGGGLYETDAFYDCCDELGLLVWQDFPFSCAMYPEEAPFPTLIEAEARDNIARLSSHPSLALWNGNNEAIWGYFDWERDGVTWRDAVADTTWGRGYYAALLPRLVEELDPSRPYWPGSPYSGTMDRSPNDDAFGCTHVWEAWFGSDYTRYRAYAPRFASEFGHQAPPTFATLAAALPEAQRAVDAPGLQHHQRSPTGQERLDDLLQKHFRVPTAFTDWMYVTQLNQVRALETGIDWFRSRHPTCQGMLYWQLNDCWPVLSWSAIDGPGRRKLLWYATRRFYKERRLSIQPADGASSGAAGPTDALQLYAYNDTDAPWTARPVVRRVSIRGEGQHAASLAVSVPPRAVGCVPIPAALYPDDPHAAFLLAELPSHGPGDRAVWFFARDRHLAYPAPAADVTVAPAAPGSHPETGAGSADGGPAGAEGVSARVTLTARSLLRDACVLADHLHPEALVSDQLFTLLPGESVAVDVTVPSERAGARLTPAALSKPPVFQCANRFGADPPQ